jgi:hypothetical protein
MIAFDREMRTVLLCRDFEKLNAIYMAHRFTCVQLRIVFSRRTATTTPPRASSDLKRLAGRLASKHVAA